MEKKKVIEDIVLDVDIEIIGKIKRVYPNSAWLGNHKKRNKGVADYKWEISETLGL